MHGRLARARKMRGNSGIFKVKRSKNKKQKYLKGNQKVQFVKVNLSLKWKKINLL
jgi:hypothetical protein